MYIQVMSCTLRVEIVDYKANMMKVYSYSNYQVLILIFNTLPRIDLGNDLYLIWILKIVIVASARGDHCVSTPGLACGK